MKIHTVDLLHVAPPRAADYMLDPRELSRCVEAARRPLSWSAGEPPSSAHRDCSLIEHVVGGAPRRDVNLRVDLHGWITSNVASSIGQADTVTG